MGITLAVTAMGMVVMATAMGTATVMPTDEGAKHTAMGATSIPSSAARTTTTTTTILMKMYSILY